MKKQKYIGIVICTVLGLMFLLFYFRITRYHVYLAARNSENTTIAEIVWKRVFPYIQGVDAFLIVKDRDNNNIKLKRRLLKNRDHFADIESEFRGLSWDGKKVILTVERNHYKGPVIIEINE